MFEYRSIMFSAFLTLLTTLFVALSIAASPVDVRNSVITLPISRRLNTSNPIINVAFNYVANVAIGNPKNNCKFNLEREIAAANGSSYTDELIIDTSSANTWVGANIRYVETPTSVNTGKAVNIPYSGGTVVGIQYIDHVNLGRGLFIFNQPIGVASNDPRIRGADGVLGLGPVQLTQGTLPDEPMKTIPTVTQSLYTQHAISQEVVGISFEPVSSTDMVYGVLTFGGVSYSARTIGY